MMQNIRFMLWSALLLPLIWVGNVSAEQTGMFTVYGEVLLADGTTYVPDGHLVTVQNLDTGVSLTGTVGATEPGKYTVVFLDFNTNRAAADGDLLKLNVKDGGGGLLATPPLHTITVEEIGDKRARIDITLPESLTNAGTVTLDTFGPPLWGYTLTWNSGEVTSWTYRGAGITNASVIGPAAAAGWNVASQTASEVVFATNSPLISSSLSGFQIEGTSAGVGSWECHASSGSVEGALPVIVSNFRALYADGVVILQWRAEGEAGLGFYVYRRFPDGLFMRVSSVRIQGNDNGTTPEEYQFVDDLVQPGETYDYYLGDVDLLGNVDRSEIIRVETRLELLNQMSPPRHSELLPNYPNPFNPETWIPYQLAERTVVMFRIHDSQGRQIRQIALGEQSPGLYLTRGRALYWDGRDNLNRVVSSGLYFYTMDAGPFHATRRMLVIR